MLKNYYYCSIKSMNVDVGNFALMIAHLNATVTPFHDWYQKPGKDHMAGESLNPPTPTSHLLYRLLAAQ
jgi:hypothetical protein